MVFSNAVFLFIFLPVVVSVYYILKQELKNLWILMASLFFYAWNRPSFIVILIGSMVINYAGAILAEKSKTLFYKKLFLFSAVGINLVLLFYFKYFNFTINTVNRLFRSDIQFAAVVLPVGISFFTFQGLSYLIDVYRNDVAAQKSFLKFGMYISMFPQLVAGPIIRYKDIVTEIDNRSASIENIAGGGIRYFITGLFKKVIIADTMAVTANAIFDREPSLNLPATAWLGILAYTLQIFFDFSGYSDMAVGLGQIFGFNFSQNFNYPYISKSITEFWRRWHISLSSFFRDYVYIPLGGNKKHVYINVAVVFLLTGIWHGAAFTFILWGIWHGFFNMLEKYLKSKKKQEGRSKEAGYAKSIVITVMQHVYTLLVVMAGWVLFRSPGVKHAIKYILSMFGIRNTDTSEFDVWFYLDNWTMLVLLLAVLMCMPVFNKLYGFLERKINGNILIPVTYSGLLLMLFLCVLQVASNTYSAFIYFQF
ncbi:MAG: MBOAT family protein [Lachnospiraceae bacterium]